VIGKVAIRREIEQRGDYTKQRAGQIMRQWCAVDSAPLKIAGQPAYTVEQLDALIAEHDAQACANKARDA
jgi:hypothetical protein